MDSGLFVLGQIQCSISILQRGHLRAPAKDEAKVALVAESNFHTDLGDRPVRGTQQLLCLGNAEMIQVQDKRLTRYLLKCAPEMRRAHVHGLCRIRGGYQI